MIEPVTETYHADNDISFQLTTVFVEEGIGYRIAYDSDDDMFYLGCKDEDGKLLYYGHYGGFIETFLAV